MSLYTLGVSPGHWINKILWVVHRLVGVSRYANVEVGTPFIRYDSCSRPDMSLDYWHESLLRPVKNDHHESIWCSSLYATKHPVAIHDPPVIVLPFTKFWLIDLHDFARSTYRIVEEVIKYMHIECGLPIVIGCARKCSAHISQKKLNQWITTLWDFSFDTSLSHSLLRRPEIHELYDGFERKLCFAIKAFIVIAYYCLAPFSGTPPGELIFSLYDLTARRSFSTVHWWSKKIFPL